MDLKPKTYSTEEIGEIAADIDNEPVNEEDWEGPFEETVVTYNFNPDNLKISLEHLLKGINDLSTIEEIQKVISKRRDEIIQES